MHQSAPPRRRQLRSVFLSDIHLGHKASRVDHLADFLAGIECETLYLLGDIIDCDALNRNFYWPDSHQSIIRQFFAMAEQGTRVIYIPGNHDDEFRVACGTAVKGVEIHREFRHPLVDGRHLLLIHGDCFDERIPTSNLLRWVGHHGSDLLVSINHWVNGVSRLTGGRYRRASKRLKDRIGRISRHIETFTEHARAAARDSDCVGVVAGHIHYPSLRHDEGSIYANCGDWVESCTGLVETFDGHLELVHHSPHPQLLASWHHQARTRWAA